MDRIELRNFSVFLEVVEGFGLEANNGDLVEFNYVCQHSNGYFILKYSFLELFYHILLQDYFISIFTISLK